MKKPSRLPLKMLYRGLELSAASEELLEEAMVRLNVDDPDEAILAALQVFLKQEPAEGRHPMTTALVPVVTSANLPIPALAPSEALALFLPDDRAGKRFAESFTVHIRNKNTRAAYLTAARSFTAWCLGKGIAGLREVDRSRGRVAAYVEQLETSASKPTAKQHLAALRMLFDWLVTGQVLPVQSGACGPRPPLLGAQREDTGALRRQRCVPYSARSRPIR